MGMYCVANSSRGYPEDVVAALAPLTKAVGDVLGRHLGCGSASGASDIGSPLSTASAASQVHSRGHDHAGKGEAGRGGLG